MQIRPARLEDLPAIAALDRAEYGPDAYPFAFFRQALELWPSLVLVAEETDGPLGYAIAGLAEVPEVVWILALVVAPGGRGRGAGRLLVQTLLARLEERGNVTVRLSVDPGNRAATGLYASLGFEVLGRDPAYLGPGEPRLLLARRPQDPRPV